MHHYQFRTQTIELRACTAIRQCLHHVWWCVLICIHRRCESEVPEPTFFKKSLFLLAVCTITCLRAAFINNASTSTFPQPVPCNSCFTHSEHISETFSYSSIRPHPQNTFSSSILPILPRLQTLSSAPSR